ncbi:MAG TPA: ABC transporter permease subunit [Verrucomicrobiae bacterium]|nr:ABC transporter permease subunit [Verrucomicrobiae bacterium]
MSLFKPNVKLSRLFSPVDVLVLAALGAIIYGLIAVGSEFSGVLRPVVEINLSPWALPRYTMLSLFRGFAAYFISLVFTLVYGYVAAYNQRAERIMVPLLDILQSIPVLGFLPSLVLALVAAFPHSNVGLELACILMIFTGQAWNMTFSFYHSLRSIPQELRDAARVYRLTAWQRLLQLELPSSAVGLVWNSMMSMAGGWFFLTVVEAFTLGDKDFRLPGIGSYMSVAMAKGDGAAMIYGVIAMMVMIVAVDQLFWRPIVAWSQKFKLEETEAATQSGSFMLELLQRSRLLRWVDNRVWTPLVAMGQPRLLLATKPGPMLISPGSATNGVRTLEEESPQPQKTARKLLGRCAVIIILLGIVWGVASVAKLLAQLNAADWLHVGKLTSLTFLRVFAAVAIGTLWTVPVGVAVGLSPKLSRITQPVIQMMASFPAPMLYPLVLILLHAAGVSINYGAVALILLGTQWYILFNVIAGATALPQDLREVATMYRMGTWEKWRRLILPGIFPYLVTGWVTAAGGAWNASIVAEYVPFRNETLVADGVGAAISVATAGEHFAMLAACVLAMCVAVVGINRILWKRLYNLAEDKFALTK